MSEPLCEIDQPGLVGYADKSARDFFQACLFERETKPAGSSAAWTITARRVFIAAMTLCLITFAKNQ
jgi:hypothetical protein